MLEGINITRGCNNGYGWSYSIELKPMFKTFFFHIFATNFDKSFASIVLGLCWFQLKGAGLGLSLSRKNLNSQFYCKPNNLSTLVSIPWSCCEVGIFIGGKNFKKTKRSTHMKFLNIRNA
jgi:hypothetical protein